ncbi:hypothetical protein HETIRDRAFT_408043 [Heterobasidion irregulare TC 32-1]|uniref:Uncharacterized protein n=1 Tax=Heterobasidion irregulare (strain TC 32-1) TaxID=747525 RepID=W4KD51_HETIT|nr:uncharacterized protein HETIRDRAFT_408043 [Heterobasidion irregulare TC 32-1]ETW83669.1 hypothetical protein HETIRDRAFT_408043 [Heterobasidion irregulare TC 32-1]
MSSGPETALKSARPGLTAASSRWLDPGRNALQPTKIWIARRSRSYPVDTAKRPHVCVINCSSAFRFNLVREAACFNHCYVLPTDVPAGGRCWMEQPRCRHFSDSRRLGSTSGGIAIR